MRFAIPGEPGPARPVVVEKRKWDGSVSARWAASLGTADDGRWLWRTSAGTLRERPRAGGVEVCARDEVTLGCGAGWLLTVCIDADGRVVTCVADAVLDPRRRGTGLVTFVDLDLDLVIDPGTGVGTLVDEADLERRAREMAYPQEVVRAAWEGIADLRGRLATRRWPFAQDGGPASASVGTRGAPGPPGPPGGLESPVADSNR